MFTKNIHFWCRHIITRELKFQCLFIVYPSHAHLVCGFGLKSWSRELLDRGSIYTQKCYPLISLYSFSSFPSFPALDSIISTTPFYLSSQIFHRFLSFFLQSYHFNHQCSPFLSFPPVSTTGMVTEVKHQQGSVLEWHFHKVMLHGL